MNDNADYSPRETSILLESIKAFPDAQRELLLKAYNFAADAHKDQKRESGEPYIIHPCAIAVILIELGMDANTIAAALLHDVIEDTNITYNDVSANFSTEIADLVNGVTKLERIDFSSREEFQVESLRKMFMAMAQDIRVLIIKLADRLHNLRTLQYRSPEKQQLTAKETLEIYAPLAHRLGISTIESELEDLSLMYLDPEAYHKIQDLVALNTKEREELVNQFISELKEKFDAMDIHPLEIAGRPKHYYSIYRKMQNGHAFDQIYDLIAIRIIVETKEQCYGVLGVVHTMYKPIPGRFKDYIAVPKENMYQSLHTTLMAEKGNVFEIQIRTIEMHRTAEYGIAAHWKYKEGKTASSKDDSFEKRLAWLRQLMDWQNDLKDPTEFMNTLKVDLFSDRVFVYTPKGDVLELPKGATPIDFAYSIHSQVGNRCIGARINGRMVPLDTKLRTGDIVEIQTSNSSKGPSRDWLNIVQTSNAKNRIRQFLKKEFKTDNTLKGREMLEDAAKRQGYNLYDLLKNEWVSKLLRRYTLNTLDDLYAAIGFGGLATNQVLSKLVEEYRKTNHQEEILKTVPAEKPEKAVQNHVTSSNGIIVKGETNMLVRLSKCCNPVPGDDIVGYITRGRGVTVHRSDCTNLKDSSFSPERLIEVEWENTKSDSYAVEIEIVAVDRVGLLADFVNTISKMGIELSGVNARVNKNGTATVDITTLISDKTQLQSIMTHFQNLPEVVEVFRVGT
ncbi:MAG: bifunctional (p)ppGpp synthetase/guanosine-3',5'-bis(diphosphate) 3'-pyrophosphohydrolase [Clostridia bacterium]|nr:bifunctional (p)ppGpp synthetase/guanosine-3',5'-bis(diphosphate) 3'-pyrophosphohydrolase [Clostridia bacterium]